MVSEAQRKATNNYRKKNVKQIILRFYPGERDQELYEWIKSQDNVTAYLKELVEKDMKD